MDRSTQYRMSEFSEYPVSKHFSSQKEGPHLLVFGAVHGNEKCGARALEDLGRKLEENSLRLERGKLSFVSICNPAAYRSNKRYKEENLNRVFHRVENPQSYEERIAQRLLDEIDSADILLDLHAFSGRGEPFSIVEEGCTASKDFAMKLPPRKILTGFTETYDSSKLICGRTSIRYAHSKGKIAITVECGSKSDPFSDEVARSVLQSALERAGLLPPISKEMDEEAQLFRFVEFHLKESEGCLAKDFEEGESVRKGDLLAKTDSGQEIRSSRDALVYFACPDAAVGTEWIYLVEPISP